ncbi:ABC-type transporter, integral membrane subunit [Rhizobium sp. CF080]|uniref:FecCD family ABC transporter permease n=1 Tax=Rhizobium sp. (strain CF080) TaxID=1144310 RepID=UPI000271CE57|nr:iron ABC transporter permease [Rhizobium sp. CF080]EUB99336.1 ABC-type transporter, integral membrane subunit [Rhizobium sp. CF080]
MNTLSNSVSSTKRFDRRFLLFMTMGVLLGVSSLWAMSVGSSRIPMTTIVDAMIEFDGSREHLVIWTVRLPRLLASLLVGASLAVAGAIMQAVTNNPLASPGLLGVNAGAALAVVLAIVFFGFSSSSVYIWCAFGGAMLTAILVYALGTAGPGGATPLKLALAGAVLSTFLASLTTAILIFDRDTLDTVRLWTIGSLAGRQMASVMAVVPYVFVGLVGALLAGRQIMTLSFGADVARSLGQNQTLWRLLAAGIVVLLAGSAVSLAGPIGFVGLVVPHIGRMVVGVDYRRIIPFCLVAGPLLVTTADAVLRYAFSSRDIPVGAAMALLGAPFFIYLARYRIGSGR